MGGGGGITNVGPLDFHEVKLSFPTNCWEGKAGQIYTGSKWTYTLPETNIAPEIDPWKRRFLLEASIFRSELLVLGRVTAINSRVFWPQLTHLFIRPFLGEPHVTPFLRDLGKAVQPAPSLVQRMARLGSEMVVAGVDGLDGLPVARELGGWIFLYKSY